jgi:hypothetical protein
LTIFFISGGLNMVRFNKAKVPLVSWMFPNVYAVDPLRDLILFHEWPSDWWQGVLILSGFALVGLSLGLGLTSRRLRRIA